MHDHRLDPVSADRLGEHRVGVPDQARDPLDREPQAILSVAALTLTAHGNDEGRTVHVTVEVADCGIAGLQDKELDGYAESPAQSIGIIEVEKGWVTLHITHQWGPTDFTVTIAERDPG